MGDALGSGEGDDEIVAAVIGHRTGAGQPPSRAGLSGLLLAALPGLALLGLGVGLRRLALARLSRLGFMLPAFGFE